jgi:hypothetical protein
VKIATFMLVAGAATVFAAPIANADKQRAVPQHKVATHGTTHKGVAPGKSAKASKPVKSGTTLTTKLNPRPPLYIYVPGFTGGSVASLDPTELCFQSMENCTDQQLCETWSMNCSTAGGQTADSTPTSALSTVEVVELGSQLSAAVSETTPSAPLAASDTTGSNDQYEDC